MARLYTVDIPEKYKIRRYLVLMFAFNRYFFEITTGNGEKLTHLQNSVCHIMESIEVTFNINKRSINLNQVRVLKNGVVYKFVTS